MPAVEDPAGSSLSAFGRKGRSDGFHRKVLRKVAIPSVHPLWSKCPQHNGASSCSRCSPRVLESVGCHTRGYLTLSSGRLPATQTNSLLPPALQALRLSRLNPLPSTLALCLQLTIDHKTLAHRALLQRAKDQRSNQPRAQGQRSEDQRPGLRQEQGPLSPEANLSASHPAEPALLSNPCHPQEVRLQQQTSARKVATREDIWAPSFVP